MDIHKNARLTPRSRAVIAHRVLIERQRPAAVAAAFAICVKTVHKWVGRYRREGEAGLKDRSSRPHRLHRPTPQETSARIEALRRLRMSGRHIAKEAGVSPATVSRVLKRLGLTKLNALAPAEPVRRYERDTPGELIHIDIKKLGKFNRTGHRITGDRTRQSNSRGIGWEYLHLAIDDHSRLAYSEILPTRRGAPACAFSSMPCASSKPMASRSIAS
ncbi:transposase [Sinorhizobium terangae]|nr:transposase [Sinorhizobium terangae]